MKIVCRTHSLVLIAVLCSLAGKACYASIVTNGSFETGDFTGWISTDIGDPFDVQAVLPTGTITLFDSFLGPNIVIPSDGSFAVSNGFDGGGPGTISLAQDIGVILPGDKLSFDFRAGWDLITFTFAGALDRLFEVLIEPAGGGAALTSDLILTAANLSDTSGGPNSDTGPLSAMIDLTSLAGVDARVHFVWTVPNDFSGPANAQLDNVVITNSGVPEPTALLVWGGLACCAAATKRRR